MFKSATIKLTLFYTAAIFLVCLVFSISIYALASSRVENEARKQETIFREYNQANNPSAQPPRSDDPGDDIRDRIRVQIKSDRKGLLSNIVMVDFVLISFGAIASYYFARKTLYPISVSMEKQKQFTSNASHELRTPLSVMKAEIGLALDQKLNAEEMKEVLKSNMEEIDRLTDLSDQLLLLTSIDKNSIEMEKVNLSEIVNAQIKTFSTNSKLKFVANIDDNIYVYGNSRLLENYLKILLENALTYTKKDQPEVKVILRKNSNNSCTLSVEDNGVGIAQEDLSKIFDRFYRSKSANKISRKGHGLGLSIASEIAKKHSSIIAVKSELDTYTIFSMDLRCYE
ncbi:MAG: HAMP domain-containing sensor histidine kinase [Acidimicrobiia bacterium]